MKKIALFVDVSNLYYTIEHIFGRRLDYSRYLNAVKKDGLVVHAAAYGSKLGHQADNFISHLKSIGFTPEYKDVKVFYNKGNKRSCKADWDVGITVDVIQYVTDHPEVDRIVIGSGDGDMAPVVKWITNQNKECVIFAANVSADLVDVATAVQEITLELLTNRSKPVKLVS